MAWRVVAALAWLCSLCAQPLTPEAFLGSPTRLAPCSYQRVYGYLSADCTGNKLADIPNLRPDVEALNAAENRINQLRNDSFQRTTGLRFLYLNDNKIFTVEPGALATLSYLEVLDLSSNRLVSVPRGLLEMPRLRKLYFNDNLLYNIDPGFRFSSPTLQLLSVADCVMAELPLGPLPELLHLNVSGNKLTSLPLTELTAQCRLHTLDLSKMPQLFLDPDIENACECHVFTAWAKLRGITVLPRAKTLCRNDSNAADDSSAVVCTNSSEVRHTSLELHGRCVMSEQQELQAAVRSWWVLGAIVAASSLLALALVLAWCQRRDARHKHCKVPVVVMTDPPPRPLDGK